MENILLASFVAVESAHAFSAFLPSIFTIKKFAEQDKDLVRDGYIPAFLFSLGLSIIVSLLIKSWLPFSFGLVTSIFMVAVYETALEERI